MKISCGVIQDLLPLYYDKVCSRETKELVEYHLEKCEACSRELAQMNMRIQESAINAGDVNIAQGISKLWKCGKRKAAAKGIAITLMCVALFVFTFILPYTKFGMKSTVKLCQSAFEQYAHKLLDSNSSCEEEYWGYRVTSYPDSDSVFFLHTKFGYDGFFYSDDGELSGFQGTEMNFLKAGSGWIWREEGGDNWMYVEHIVGNWYWYEMHF